MRAFIWLVSFETAAFVVYAETPKDIFSSSIRSLENVSDSTNELESFSRLESAWAALAEGDKTAAWPQMSLAYINECSKRFESKDFVAAARYLKLAGELNNSFGGRLEYATKSPNTFFKRLACIQTEIASKTGIDPLAGIVNYLFQKDGSGYIVVRQEFDPEVNGVTIAGVSESEFLLQAHYFSENEGKVTFEKTRWFIGPKGSVLHTLNHATMEVLQDEYGRFESKPIQGAILANSVKANAVRPAAQSAPISFTAPLLQKSKVAPSPVPMEETNSAVPGFPVVPAAILAFVIVGILLFIRIRK